MRLKSKKIIFIFQLLFLEIFSRSIFTPVPGTKEEHYNFFEKNKNDKYFFPFLKFFFRGTNGAFGYEDILENNSTIFHGYPSFEISDLFYDSQRENIQINGENLYIDGLAEPNHSMSNFGTTLGFDFFKSFEMLNLIFYLRLPIQFLNIEQKEGYNALSFFRNFCPEKGLNKFSANILRDIISGKFKNGKEIDWSKFQNFGFGNLDLEINFQKLIFKEKLLLNLITGIVFPTDEQISFEKSNNYLATSFGNNNHYEFRFGAQGILKVFSFLDFLIYGTFNNIFSKTENLIASFKGANAFGLQPTFVDAKVNWNQLVFITDLIFKPLDSLKILIGYSLIKKNNDNIYDYDDFAYDAIENRKKVDFEKVSLYSERKVHKLKGSINFNYKNLNFEIFSSTVLKGEDSLREFDLGFSFGTIF